MHPAFQVHTLTPEGQEFARHIAEEFDALLICLTDILPPGRELALVTTKLEEACFYAKKGMALNHTLGG